MLNNSFHSNKSLYSVDTCLKHFEFSLKWKGDRLGNVEMRRHYANYFKGFHNFKHFRMQLVTEHDNSRILEILEEIRTYYTENEFAPVGVN